MVPSPGREPGPLVFRRDVRFTPRRRELLHERDAREHLPDRIAISSGFEADGHGLSVALGDEHVGKPCLGEHVTELEQVRLVARSQSYGNSAGWVDRPAVALANRVNRLGNLRPMGEVAADDDVVDQVLIGVAFAGLPGVNGSCRRT